MEILDAPFLPASAGPLRNCGRSGSFANRRRSGKWSFAGRYGSGRCRRRGIAIEKEYGYQYDHQPTQNHEALSVGADFRRDQLHGAGGPSSRTKVSNFMLTVSVGEFASGAAVNDSTTRRLGDRSS